MSTNVTDAPAPRVREQAREVLAVMALSAGLSLACSLALLLIIASGGQG
jgi:hypothetical protein